MSTFVFTIFYHIVRVDKFYIYSVVAVFSKSLRAFLGEFSLLNLFLFKSHSADITPVLTQYNMHAKIQLLQDNYNIQKMKVCKYVIAYISHSWEQVMFLSRD